MKNQLIKHGTVMEYFKLVVENSNSVITWEAIRIFTT